MLEPRCDKSFSVFEKLPFVKSCVLICDSPVVCKASDHSKSSLMLLPPKTMKESDVACSKNSITMILLGILHQGYQCDYNHNFRYGKIKDSDMPTTMSLTALVLEFCQADHPISSCIPSLPLGSEHHDR